MVVSHEHVHRVGSLAEHELVTVDTSGSAQKRSPARRAQSTVTENEWPGPVAIGTTGPA